MAEPDNTTRASGKGRAGIPNLDHLTVAELTAVIGEAEALRREKQEEAKAALLAKWQAEAAENNLSLNPALFMPTGSLPHILRSNARVSLL